MSAAAASSMNAPRRPHLDLSRVSSLGEALADAVVPFKSNVALIECDREREVRRLGYADLAREAEAAGAQLQRAGIGPGDRVAIVQSNQSRWITAATGALWAGAVLVPLDYKLSAAEIVALLGHCRPRALIIEHPLFERMRREVADAPVDSSGLTIVVTGAPEDCELGGAERFGEGPAEGDHGFARVARARDDVACIVYSSGTAGSPKGCVLTHGNYLAQAEILGNLYPMAEDDRFFSILPTNHAIDFMCGFIVPLLFGASIVHQRTLRPNLLSATMKRYRVTHMALVPAVLSALREKIEASLEELPPWKRALVDGLIGANAALTVERPRPELSRRLLAPIHDALGGRLRVLVCGGAMVERSDAELLYRLGIPVAIGYGLTEACTVVTVNDLAPFRGDTVGRPVPGVEVLVKDPGSDGVGEVWVRGPTVMQGYLDAPGLTAETLAGGWLCTGDLGRFDAAGHLSLVGRSRNMIVTAGGKNIYPEDVEAAFGGLPDCEELCVFAADYIWPRRGLDGEELVAVVRGRPGGAGEGVEGAVSDRLRGALSARNRALPAHKRLQGFIAWPERFPRTASLKVKRDALAAAVREGCERTAVCGLSASGAASGYGEGSDG